MTIGLPANCAICTFALVLAIVAPGVVGTWRLTKISGPPRQAVTYSIDVRAFAAVFAKTLLMAVRSICSFLAGMVAGDSNVTWPAFEFTGDVITRCLWWHILGTPFFAIQSKVTVRTLLVTRATSPSSFTEALAGCRITRGIILAVALMLALGSIESQRTRAFAANTSILDGLAPLELCFAETLSVYWVAGVRLLLFTDALEGTVLSEVPRIAFLFASFSSPSGTAIAFTGSWMAATVVQAFAGLGTAFSIGMDFARTFTLEATPPGLAEALTRLRIAISSIFTFAPLGTVLAIGGCWTSLFAFFPGEAWLADA